MKGASRDKSRVSANASTLDQHHHKQNVQDSTPDITEDCISRKISWVGPQMATWRTTGYVADSEGEDEEIDVSFQRHRSSSPIQKDNVHKVERLCTEGIVTTNDNGEDPSRFSESATPPVADGSNAAQHSNDPEQVKAGTEFHTVTYPTVNQRPSEDELLLPIADVGQPLAENVSTPTRDVFSLEFEDSPLSTPPDSPILIPDPGNPQVEKSPASDLILPSAYATSRNFRPRKAIQINPYLLDFAKHQKEWGERGLKPVYIPRPPSPQRREQGADSQEFASHDDTQASANLVQRSMDLDEMSVTNEIGSLEFDGGLPDLDSVLRENATTRRRHAESMNRARRTAGQTTTPNNIFDLPSSDDQQAQRRKNKTQSSGLHHDSFPSPPRSRSLSIHDRLPSSHSEVSESPKPLTPAASGGLRSHRWRHVIEDDSQSQNGAVSGFVSISSSEGSDESSVMESESEDVRLMQKKLRGVIPASYLTVQKAQQAMTKTRREAAKAAAQSISGPGVAQRRLGKTSYRATLEETTSRWYEGLASEEEESQKVLDEDASNDLAVGNEFDTGSDRPLELFEDIEAVETMEDAGVDEMLPARSRIQKVRRKQQRDPTHHSNVTGKRKRRHSYQIDNAGRVIRPRKRVRRPPSKGTIHVLDAPGLSPKNVTRPPWLRIAARQAKRTRTAGTSVVQKVFQLDSAEETSNALESLVDRVHTPVSHRSDAAAKKPVAHRRANKSSSDNLFTPIKTNPRSQTLKWPSLRPLLSQGNVLTQHQDEVNDNSQQNETEPARINRLISLLSRRNRAGQGQLVYRATEPRLAQIEELQQNYRGLTGISLRRPPAFPQQREIPVTELDRPTSVTESVDKLSRLGSSLTDSAALPQGFAREPKRKKKQTPVYRPKVHQTLLAPLKLHTERLYTLLGRTGPDVRTELEREFVAHQAEWFQGRKEGIICANEATQQHFQVFLEVLKSYLLAVSNASSEADDTRGHRSFLYRLVPNRGSIGAQGQVGDKSMDMLSYDILVARNVFDLHVFLLNLAPAYAPLPRVLETKVNFADAHNEICLIALSAWQAICGHHHTQHFIIDGLCGWLYLILTQLLARWKSAESDARAEAEQSLHKIEERIVRKVIEHNRAQASKLLSVALNSMVQAIEDSITSTEAESLLDINRYTDFASAVSKLPNINDDVYRAMFKAAYCYASQWLTQTPSIVTSLISTLRQAISTLTSHVDTLMYETQALMIQAFFSTARTAVSHRQKSWDDFFAPTSAFSLSMFVSDKHVDSSKALFYQHLLDTEVDAYLLDFRGPVLSHWFHVLLQQQDEPSRVGFTCSILNQEKASLDLSTLAALFHAPGTTIPTSTVRDSISEIRHAAVLHVIAELSGQENNAEAEWLPGGLDESDAVHLLKTIFSTMKETWMSLSDYPEQQDNYTLLIHAALDQYEIHSRSDFAVEAWFLNPIMIPQRRKRTLAKVLGQHGSSDEDFIRSAADVMQQEAMHAKRSDKFEELTSELKSILFPRIGQISTTPQDTKRTSIWTRHACFIRDVLLPLARQDEASRKLVLDILYDMASSLECRIPFHDKTIFVTLTYTFMVAIVAISDALSTMEADARAKVYMLTLVTFESLMTEDFILPDNFMESIGHICDLAMQDESTEGFALIEAVVSRG